MIQNCDAVFDDKIGPARWLICKVTCFQKFESGLNRPFFHLKRKVENSFVPISTLPILVFL